MSNLIRILIADDHQLIIDGIKMHLANVRQIKIVAEATNGKEALTLLKKIPVDLVLMDVDMPVMNGFDTTRAITLQFPAVKIIALTMFDEKSIILKMMQAGAKGYLLKSVKKEELLQAITTVMEGKEYFSSDVHTALAQKTIDVLASKVQQQQLTVPLSSREMEIIKLIAQGLTSKEISEKLFISVKTAETHRTHIMRKIDAHNVAGLIKFAIQNGLTD